MWKTVGIRVELLERLRRYAEKAQPRVTLNAITEAAVRQWLDANEPKANEGKEGGK